jgi:hypothetical protein
MSAHAYEEEFRPAVEFTPSPYIWCDPADIPPRQWLFGKHLIRGFVSATVAPGGLGKSSLLQVEALAMVTGRALMGDAPPEPLRVWCWNGEDPQHELQRRIAAACLHYQITTDQIDNRLMNDSGRDVPITIAQANGQGVQVAVPTRDALIKAIQANDIDVLVVDPFATSHSVPENDNAAMNAVISAWRDIAAITNCAIELVHHVSKAGAMNGDDLGIYAARGAGALIDGVRSARFLTRMRSEEAEKFGIEEQDAPRHFRVNDGKANLAPPDKATWRRMISVHLGNGADLWPEGDHVGVATVWTPPDAFEGMTARDLMRVQQAIEASETPPKANERATDWIGYVIGDSLGLDLGRDLKKQERNTAQNIARAKVRQLLSGWLKSRALVIEGTHDTRTGRDIKTVQVGEAVSSADLSTVNSSVVDKCG